MKPHESPNCSGVRKRGAHVVEAHRNVPLKLARQEAWAIVGDQHGAANERTMEALRLCLRLVDGDDQGPCVETRRQVNRQQIAAEVVDDRHRIPPAVAGDVHVGHVGLPEPFGPWGSNSNSFAAWYSSTSRLRFLSSKSAAFKTRYTKRFVTP